jgi:hypothetical protein
MTIADVDAALSEQLIKPKGIKVGVELFQALKQAGRITMKPGIFGSVDCGLDFPVMNENIFVWPDVDMGQNDFMMPKSK